MRALQQLPSESNGNRRRSERVLLDRPTTMTLLSGDRSLRCRLADLSYGGLRVHLEGQVHPGERVSLEHGFIGKLQGLPVWQRGSELGIELQVAQSELLRALQCVGLLLSPDRQARERSLAEAGAGAG